MNAHERVMIFVVVAFLLCDFMRFEWAFSIHLNIDKCRHLELCCLKNGHLINKF